MLDNVTVWEIGWDGGANVRVVGVKRASGDFLWFWYIILDVVDNDERVVEGRLVLAQSP